MGITAVALRLRHRAAPVARLGATAPMVTEPATSSNVQSARGLGAGAPPTVEVPRGARMLHGDARHTHRAAGHAPLDPPVVAWSRDVGGPVEAQVTTSPDGQTLYVATLAGSLVAVAREDGAVRWTLPLGDRAYATPAVADDGTI